MTALNNNKETSINPMIIMDKAIDMSTRLSGSQFPVSIFPAKIQRIIKEVHECHSFPTDYISAAILTALAVGIGNTHLAQMKQGWLESPILYMALIGRPGANKSHPLSFAMKPFLDYDYEQNKKIIPCEYCGRILIDPELAGVKIESPKTEEKPKRKRAIRRRKTEDED